MIQILTAVTVICFLTLETVSNNNLLGIRRILPSQTILRLDGNYLSYYDHHFYVMGQPVQTFRFLNLNFK